MVAGVWERPGEAGETRAEPIPAGGGIVRRGRRTGALKVCRGVAPSLFASANFLNSAGVEDLAVREELQRARRGASEVARVGGLIDDAEVTGTDHRPVERCARDRIREADDAADAVVA